MVVGGAAAAADVPVPLVEAAIISSVLALGTLIAAAAKPGPGVAVAVVSAFALFHGYAHVSEMTSSASPAAYVAGFAVSTASLHAAGIAFAVALRRPRTLSLVRASGALIVAAGMLVFAA